VFKWLAALLVIVCIAMAVTNPNAEAHQKVFYANLPKEMGLKGIWQKLAGGALQDLDVVPLKYHNYFFFSTMALNDETVSYGLFNQIWEADRVEAIKQKWVPEKAKAEQGLPREQP